MKKVLALLLATILMLGVFSFVYADLPGFCQTGSLPDPFDEKGFVQQHGAVCEDGEPVHQPDGG